MFRISDDLPIPTCMEARATIVFPDPKPVAGCYGEKNQTSPDILFSWNDMDAWWEELKLMSCYSPDGTANCHVSPFLNQMSNGPFRET